MVEIKVKLATREDCFDVARRLRADDYIELRHMHGSDIDPGWVLELCRLSVPRETFCLSFDGQRAAVFGCPESQPGIGVPWLMGTDDLPRFRFTFHSLAKKAVSYWGDNFNHMSNLVWKDSRSVPWLKSLGFEVSDEVTFETGSGGEFVRFNKIKEVKKCATQYQDMSASK